MEGRDRAADTGDDGDQSIRDALAQSNSGPGADPASGDGGADDGRIHPTQPVFR